MFLRAAEFWFILGLAWFNSYFAFIAQEKLHVSLICSFYCFFVKEGWSLKVS